MSKTEKCDVMNGKTTSLGELTRALEEEMGSAVTSVKTITSSELLQGLDSQQYGSLILDYLPEMMDKETVITRTSGATPMMRKIMEDGLPDGVFGTKELDRANFNTLKEAVETISQPVCPLSRNIRCTTDKSTVLDELREAMNMACESYNRHDKECSEATEKALETEEKLKAIDSDNNAADRKEQRLHFY